ncbi:hypothetical protein R1sor_016628 [Riccia sorocarpa]|uniref:SET domain-containing protein n=1 Tax=Riccia sorocarpa TaxID=122646 RepID=A0ABD3HLU4_9MARC
MGRRRANSAGSSTSACEGLVRKGDAELTARDYEKALEYYSSALQVKPDDPSILSKRAQVFNLLEKYELALKDAEISLQLSGGQDRGTQFHLAQALYGMRCYQEASDALEKLRAMKSSRDSQRFPSNKRVRKLVELVERRLDEKLHGSYDLHSMLKQAKAMAAPFLDHADFVGPVRVAEVEGCLAMKVVERMIREPQTVAEVYSLFAGEHTPALQPHPAETHELPVDEVRVRNIVRHCSFQMETVTELWIPLSIPDDFEDNKSGLGLWILPSFINHSCLANARHYTIGDFMFVRAIRDLAEGEEVLISYVDPFLDHSVKKLQMLNFVCRCSLCSFAQEHPEVMEFRSALTWLFQRLRPRVRAADYSILPQLQQIIRSLRRTFNTLPHSSFSSGSALPPLELYSPLMGESSLHFLVGNFEQAVSPLLEVFEFLPRLDGIFSNSIARTDVAWRLRSIYKKLGNSKEMKKWTKRARDEFDVMIGKSDELWEKYVGDYAAAHEASIEDELDAFMSFMVHHLILSM